MTRGRAVLVPALVVVFAITSGGWLLQRGVGMRANIYLHARVFEEVVERIEGHFVGEVDVDDLYEAAIAGVVDHLGDPNSQFLPAARWEDERIRTQGEYGGVGLEVADRDGYITVVAPIPGTPGARAGVRPGDRIVEVDGRSVEGWLTDQAVDLLRGRPGTTVRMGIRRPGADAIIHFDVTRAQIHVPSVPFATMLDEGVGYVPLLIFNRTTTKEVRAAIDSLAAEGMTSLVLDLRRNRGGLLTEGVGLTDLFLDPGMDIVEIRSRASAPEKYAAMVDQSYPDLPVVVLVGYGSASAAEIVAGALQDHDRALLIGSTTYGKGSVQSLFPLSGGNVLKLTTARWFTPSGRSIEMEAADQAARGDRGVLTVQGDVAELPELADKPEFRVRRRKAGAWRWRDRPGSLGAAGHAPGRRARGGQGNPGVGRRLRDGASELGGGLPPGPPRSGTRFPPHRRGPRRFSHSSSRNVEPASPLRPFSVPGARCSCTWRARWRCRHGATAAASNASQGRTPRSAGPWNFSRRRRISGSSSCWRGRHWRRRRCSPLARVPPRGMVSRAEHGVGPLSGPFSHGSAPVIVAESRTLTVSVHRGPVLESTHRVHAAVSDEAGRVVRCWGDPGRITLLRSAAKPFQALPLVADGAADHFGLSQEEIALCCGSHNSEEEHLAVARSILAKAELEENLLVCGPHPPLLRERDLAMAAEGVSRSAIINNCSGKHAGMLAAGRRFTAGRWTDTSFPATRFSSACGGRWHAGRASPQRAWSGGWTVAG